MDDWFEKSPWPRGQGLECFDGRVVNRARTPGHEYAAARLVSGSGRPSHNNRPRHSRSRRGMDSDDPRMDAQPSFCSGAPNNTTRRGQNSFSLPRLSIDGAENPRHFVECSLLRLRRQAVLGNFFSHDFYFEFYAMIPGNFTQKKSFPQHSPEGACPQEKITTPRESNAPFCSVRMSLRFRQVQGHPLVLSLTSWL